MSETKHTPTPWKVFYTSKNGDIILGIGEMNGQGITDYQGQMWGDPEEAKANAEFIVRAVNGYEETQKKLEVARESFDKIRTICWGGYGEEENDKIDKIAQEILEKLKP